MRSVQNLPNLRALAALQSVLVRERVKSPCVRALLPRFAGTAGMEKRVHDRGLRHTHAA
jgi:hypothetical protein